MPLFSRLSGFFKNVEFANECGTEWTKLISEQSMKDEVELSEGKLPI